MTEKKKRPAGYDAPQRGYVRRTCILHKFALKHMRQIAEVREISLKDCMEEAMKDWCYKYFEVLRENEGEHQE
jgi:hypothetical protein